MKNNSLLGLLSVIALTSFALPNALANEHPKGMAPDDALQLLKEGNGRFAQGKTIHPNQGPDRRIALSKGQTPHSIILSCSDSRVPPELVFDQGLGEVFSVRVAGNTISQAGVASIEYAVEHLGSQLIVVMGHESCGAVKATLQTPEGKTAGSPHLDTLVATIRPGLEGYSSKSVDEDKTLKKPVMSNVDYVATRLMQTSKIIRNRVESGQLKIVKSSYALSSGSVSFWGDTPSLPTSRMPASSHSNH